MTPALKAFTEQYTALELGIQELLPAQCKTLCSQCTRVCCDVIHCREAHQSPFLQQIHQQADRFHEQHGFLSSTGCVLEKGRPPICYQYFCDDHYYYQPDDRHAQVLKILGALLNHVGYNAKGSTPLEDLNAEELDQLDFRQLRKQLNESLHALELIRTFYHEGTLPENAWSVLEQIHLGE